MTGNVRIATAVALVGLLLASAAFIVRASYFAPRTITAYFVSATGIYSGDEVRIAGVKVGTIAAVEPMGGQARMTLSVDRGVPVPADAKAVIVAQSLIAARYVQLAPAYETSGPTMADEAVIPVDRTAIPVEWDEVKAQLTRLATDLGPQSGVSGTSLSRFIDSAANAPRVVIPRRRSRSVSSGRSSISTGCPARNPSVTRRSRQGS